MTSIGQQGPACEAGHATQTAKKSTEEESEGRRSLPMKPKVVYLDQNMWICLARAYHGHAEGQRYRSVLRDVQRAVSSGNAVLPLSDAHVIETRKTADLPRRRRLAQVMAEISRGWTLAPASYIVPRELEAAAARLFGEAEPNPPIAVGRGIAFAFGVSERLDSELGISKQHARLLEILTGSPPALVAFLVGDDEALDIQAITDFRRREHLFAKRVEKARRLGKGYSKAVRRRAYVAELTYHLQPDLAALLSRRGKSLEDFLAIGRTRLMDFFKQTPTLDVETELATERDEHRDREIDPNDMVDVSALSVAIPYCDVVVTERFWTDLARRRKLDEKYQTVVLDDLCEIENYLDVPGGGPSL